MIIADYASLANRISFARNYSLKKKVRANLK